MSAPGHVNNEKCSSNYERKVVTVNHDRPCEAVNKLD